MNERKSYDSTVARIAGNIMSGMRLDVDALSVDQMLTYVEMAVALARAIVAETKRTDPAAGA